MIRINLLPVRDAQRAQDRRRQVSVVLLSLTATLLLMVVPYVLQSRKLSKLDFQISQLNIEVSKLNEQAREVREIEKKRTELQAKLKVIDDLNQKRVGPVRMLEDLGVAVPEKLWLVEFNDVNSNATISGMALDNQTVAMFMRRLQASKYFFDVDLEKAYQGEPVRGPLGSDSGIAFKKFIVKAHLDYLGTGGKAQAAQGSASAGAPKTGT
jgi:type IV pilus assembly protein PilN